MENFRISPISETDIDGIVRSAGGTRAHPDADRRQKQGADFVLGNALIELKALDEDGLDKPMRQTKLATLFEKYEGNRPVVVLDRERLPPEGQRIFDRTVEGPVKRTVASARKQLAQSRLEYPEARVSILLVVNNGYTALDHESLKRLVAHRVRNDTEEIDGVVVAGCYFYSDTFDSYFLWQMDYVPIHLDRTFEAYDRFHAAWNDFSESVMTALLLGQVNTDATKGPIVDTQFDLDGVTYVKPAPPMGDKSTFFRDGRPRQNSSGLTRCPPVAITSPFLSRAEWASFRESLPAQPELHESYEVWLKHAAKAQGAASPLQPLIEMPVTQTGWRKWREQENASSSMASIRKYANALFDSAVHMRIAAARERVASGIIPARYVFAVTEEIGQDRGNDVSHIFVVAERPGRAPAVRPLVENVRIFHEHAVALACAYSITEGIECVLWEKELQYAWV